MKEKTGNKNLLRKTLAAASGFELDSAHWNHKWF